MLLQELSRIVMAKTERRFMDFWEVLLKGTGSCCRLLAWGAVRGVVIPNMIMVMMVRQY